MLGLPNPQAERRYPINLFRSVRGAVPDAAGHVTPAKLAERMREGRALARKEDAPLLTLVKYRADAVTRGTADIEEVHAIYGDIDKNFDSEVFEAALSELEQAGVQAVAYQTYNHRPDAPRWRVFVLLDEPVGVEDYRACWEGLNVIFGGMLDGNAKDAARLNYWPSCPPGETREVRTLNIEVPS